MVFSNYIWHFPLDCPLNQSINVWPLSGNKVSRYLKIQWWFFILVPLRMIMLTGQSPNRYGQIGHLEFLGETSSRTLDQHNKGPRGRLYPCFGRSHHHFHKHGGSPIAGWFVREHPIKMDDWGYPYFRKPYCRANAKANIKISTNSGVTTSHVVYHVLAMAHAR